MCVCIGQGVRESWQAGRSGENHPESGARLMGGVRSSAVLAAPRGCHGVHISASGAFGVLIGRSVLHHRDAQAVREGS